MLQSCTALRYSHVFSGSALIKRLTVACCAGALMLSLGGGTPAYAGDDEEEAYELQFLKKMFGITDQAPIDYRERSPLVVPPTRNLPSPETVAAEANPNWPKDPEKQPKKKGQKLSVTDQQIAGKPISPYEMDKGRKAGAGLTPSRSQDGGDRISPSELGYKGGLFSGLFKDQDKGDVAVFEGEGPRTTLTAPPTGYMTPSPNQPYGLGAKKEAPKPYKLEDRGTEQR
jgi:hypothetical protein